MEASMRVLVLAACLLCSALTCAEAHRPTHQRRRAARDSVDGRLPRDVLPYHYDLEIQPDIYLAAPPFPFSGTVSISFDCVTATNIFIVNSVDLTINSVSVAVSPDSVITPPAPGVASWRLEPEADFLNIGTVNQLVAGAKYVVTISYNGTLRSDGNGIYYDSYVAGDGSTKYILSTQLEDIAARLMFPSFDEIDMKATFTITVVHHSTVTALSNMPVVRVEPRTDPWVATYYDRSPVMSTYHVCVSIGELSYIESNWQGVTTYPIRVYARPDIISQMAFVADLAPKVQLWLEQETGVPYGLPKMDHLALPHKGGAMENWGLITYGEEVFAVNPETSSTFGKQYIGSFLTHELAHQWYGNIVTAKWWNDIWLNEGLATYYDYLPMEAIGWPGDGPQQLDTQYFMDQDQKNTSDPVRKDIPTPWDSWISFEGSTYPKGGAMVRMLNGILTENTLKRGLTRYLNKFAFGSVTTDDLWQALTDQANSEGYMINVKSVMDPWLNQMGFPVVTMNRKADGTATVTSQYFLSPPFQQINVPSDYNYKWTIPLTVVTAALGDGAWYSRPKAWLDISANAIEVSGLPTDLNEWVILNSRQFMYYRVNYDDANRAAIVSQLLTDHTKITNDTRSGLIEDTFELARAAYILETAAMEFTRYLANDRAYNPWYSALKFTALPKRALSGFSWYGNFQSYMLSLLTPVYNAVGYTYNPDEIPDDQLLRRDIVSASCAYGLASCLDSARADWAVYSQNPAVNSVNANNLPVVLCTGVKEGTSADWDIVYNQYQARRNSQIREERRAYLFGLACSTDSATLDRYLNDIIGGVQIASRDQYRATLYLSGNVPLGADKVWNYFDANWATVPSGMSKFSVLTSITSKWADQASLDKLNTFIANHPPLTDSQWQYYNQMQLTVKQNVNWLNTNQDSLRDWIIAQAPRTAPETGSPTTLSATEYWHGLWAATETEVFYK